MNDIVAHCLFERSGTFKNEFIKLGIKAFDYDLLNDFNCVDFQIDLFKEIDNAFWFNQTIFDNMKPNDIIIAFFPCTRFEDQSTMLLNGNHNGIDQWSNISKLNYALSVHQELHDNYDKFTKLCIIALRKNLKLVIENPYSKQHYLCRYFPIKSTIIDRDRSKNGDDFFKPTQYWFINWNPYYNVYDLVSYLPKHRLNVSQIPSQSRSFIQSEYAARFIKSYLLPGDYVNDNT